MKKLSYLLIALTLLIGFSNATLNDSVADDGYKVGDAAIDFKLKNVDGKMVAMSDFKNAKGIILIFTCNTCPYSKIYEERIIELDNKYASQGYPVVAINPNDPVRQPGDSFELMQKRAKEKGFTFPYLVDKSQEIAKTYGATRTPHVFLLNKTSNKFKVAYIGAIDNNHKSANDASELYVEDAVEALKAGKSVSKDFTKAIGCSIKWKNS